MHFAFGCVTMTLKVSSKAISNYQIYILHDFLKTQVPFQFLHVRDMHLQRL